MVTAVGVIEFKSVRGNAVTECGVSCAYLNSLTPKRHVAVGFAANGKHFVEQSCLGAYRTGNPGADRVENVTLSFDDKLFGDVFKFGPNNETCELFGNELRVFALHKKTHQKGIRTGKGAKRCFAPKVLHILEENEA